MSEERVEGTGIKTILERIAIHQSSNIHQTLSKVLTNSPYILKSYKAGLIKPAYFADEESDANRAW